MVKPLADVTREGGISRSGPIEVDSFAQRIHHDATILTALQMAVDLGAQFVLQRAIDIIGEEVQKFRAMFVLSHNLTLAHVRQNKSKAVRAVAGEPARDA